MRAGVAGWLVEAREFGECQARASREPVDGSRERPLRDGGNGAIEGSGLSTGTRKVSDPPAQDRRRGEVSSGGDETVRGSEDRMGQSPLMGVVEGDGEGAEQRGRRAWARVADGYREALSLLCPGDADYERMRRCLAKTTELAGVPRLSLARPRPSRRAAG